ncbi:ATPase, AAA-type, core, P-loop containing nucleoside triphosphate hydrolase [Artemisia annua]|uniref:ATPase, AAA-type, core, P-loop containing nucleoside triphosphate hydrolase n=1 Tax=Artemisia annua TaxID=35608 RepID=A0A2U1M9F1_ARTAN|nr:ATPase, AAA-type, core, P-loop containing nucleoside triphosphate hydrolase [Artemisia annua]
MVAIGFSIAIKLVPKQTSPNPRKYTHFVICEGLLAEGFFWIPSLAGPTTVAAQQCSSGISWLFPFLIIILYGIVYVENAQVMVLAATNRPSELDESFMESLRCLSQEFEIGIPNRKERAAILTDERAEEDIDLDSIAAFTSDYDKEKLQERLAKLSGGVVVLKASKEKAPPQSSKPAKSDGGMKTRKKKWRLRAGYKVVEAENKSFVAAEAVKQLERVTKMAEEAEAFLQLI